MCKIAVIDSGSGGISTLCALRNLLPFEEYIYVADKSCAPYGDKSDEFIKQRVLSIRDCLVQSQNIKAMVIACNTATSAGIEQLRESGDGIIYVGVEPAVKPALTELQWGKVLILLTPATARQQKFLRLISLFEAHNNRLIIAPMQGLATLVENHTDNLSAVKQQLYSLLKPFKDESIESVVIGCTHYCLISHYISDFFKAKIYDGNAGTAIRLHEILKQKNLISRRGGGVEFLRI